MSKVEKGDDLVSEDNAAELKKQRTSPQVEAHDKWEWLYKVGVMKVMEQKRAGREHEEIVIERERHEYTFQPNKRPSVVEVSQIEETLRKKPLMARPRHSLQSAWATRPSKPTGNSQFIT